MSSDGNSALGVFSWKTRVCASGADMLPGSSMSPSTPPCGEAVAGSMTCWMEAIASAAVKRVPSWKRTSRRRRKVHVTPSADADHSSARSGIVSPFSSSFTSRL
ncbi:hypothetical protein BC477_08520 [Clavibacter michiganensis subsp. michiganensis]|uniref:Uncharacterized protein n=1 Tax=Clavibacter michiganensis subsp. michiganensis TaxID=33013 RepID=A0A251XMS5_CLAMM|nr:hypothetical protein BC477_08520 [Clavibacter michiganensis subsp. michiganensis]OUE04767.1 hypothetical protein CMMCAS07_07450 [Clavibacter michiganensis subsp. michiganensis]